MCCLADVAPKDGNSINLHNYLKRKHEISVKVCAPKRKVEEDGLKEESADCGKGKN